MTQRWRALCAACAQVLFLPGAAAGAVVLGVACLRPTLGLTALVSVGAAWGIAWLLGHEREFTAAGHFLFNPWLVGLSLGARYDLTAPLALLCAAAGALSFVATLVLANLLAARCRLPVLSLPFALVSLLAHLAAARFPAVLLPAAELSPLLAWEFGLPPAAAAFCRALGSIVFVPSVLGGAVLALLILRTSRILLALAVGGFALGVVVRAVLFGSWEQALVDGSNFNSILIAMGLGGVFLVPSLRSAVLAASAVVVALLVLEALTILPDAYGTPPFTLPFCLVAIVAVYVLRQCRSPLLSNFIGRTPEEVRENWLVDRRRYRGDFRTLRLPFSGRWTVWQGFNGRWTHRGIWRYAYDFVVTDEQGHTHRGDGSQLADYYCYRLPVLAPVCGRVVRVVDTLPDNPAGTVHTGHAASGGNWGNLVILHDPRGFYVEISHFSPGTIRVAEGAWVEQGSPLGLCGNSGNSPQPHLHVQVQAADAPGAATLPFSFVCYLQADRHHANDLPPEGSTLEPLPLDKVLDEAMSFVIDDVHAFEVRRRGRRIGVLHARVALAADGTYCLDSGRGRLYFGKHEGTYYAYRCEGRDPYLRLLLLALPRLPLVGQPGLAWDDYVPASQVLSLPGRWLAQAANLAWPALATVRVAQRLRRWGVVESVLESPLLRTRLSAQATFEPAAGLSGVRVGDLELVRIGVVSAAEAAPLPAPRNKNRRRVMVACGIACMLATAAGVGAVHNSSPQRETQHREINAAVQQSRTLEDAQSYQEAIDALLPLQRAHGGHYTLNLRLGWLYYLAGRYPDSQQHYLAARAAAPLSLEARLGHMLPLLALGRYPEVESLARDVILKDPGNYYANFRLALALRLQGKLDEADKIVAQMLRAYPTDALLLGERAVLRPGESTSTARTSRQAAAEADIAACIQTSLASEAEQKYLDAVQVLMKPYAQHKDHYTLNLRLGWLHYLWGKYHDAAQFYQQAQRLAPTSREARLGHLLVLLADGKYAEVKPLADKVLVGDPGNYLANLRLAVGLRLDGKLADAQKVVDRMLRWYPSDVNFLGEAAQLKLAQNDASAARRLFEDILALDPANAAAKAQLAAEVPP